MRVGVVVFSFLVFCFSCADIYCGSCKNNCCCCCKMDKKIDVKVVEQHKFREVDKNVVEKVNEIIEEVENEKMDGKLPVVTVKWEENNCVFQAWLQIQIRNEKFLMFFRKLKEAGIINRDKNPVCWEFCEFVDNVLKNREDKKSVVSCIGILREFFNYKNKIDENPKISEGCKKYLKSEDRQLGSFHSGDSLVSSVLDIVKYELYGDKKAKCDDIFDNQHCSFFVWSENFYYTFLNYICCSSADCQGNECGDKILNSVKNKEIQERIKKEIIKNKDGGFVWFEKGEEFREYFDKVVDDLYRGEIYIDDCDSNYSRKGEVKYKKIKKVIGILVSINEYHRYPLLFIERKWYNYDCYGEKYGEEMKEKEFKDLVYEICCKGKVGSHFYDTKDSKICFFD